MVNDLRQIIIQEFGQVISRKTLSGIVIRSRGVSLQYVVFQEVLGRLLTLLEKKDAPRVTRTSAWVITKLAVVHA